VFKLAPNGTETILYAFKRGRYPLASLLKGAHGRLYGTTYQGGTYHVGVVFSVKK
jgi:hypothetical protein